jgi:hypothetical protein
MPLLKELNALEIFDLPLKGGTTKPLLVTCDDGNQYILKIFKKIHAQQRCYTGAEVCAYLLAKEFNLYIPDGALITIPQNLINLYKQTNPELYKEIMTKDFANPCFGSHYQGALPIHSPTLLKKYFELHELETIYAFDTFILNEDRKKIKPNILKGQEHYFLIDHDKAFEGYNHTLNVFLENNQWNYYINHIFFDILKKEEKKENNSVKFETFEEYLRLLNIGKIRKQVERLEALNYSVSECYDWLNYFETIKRNSSIFVTLLKNSIKS